MSKLLWCFFQVYVCYLDYIKPKEKAEFFFLLPEHLNNLKSFSYCENTSYLKQVVGGKMTESGRLCAFITKVKKGSLADTVGHLRPGMYLL